MNRRAAVGSVNPKTRTFDVTWSTGAPVLRSSWGGSFWEELSMDPKHVRMGRLQSGAAPFLPNHDSWDVASTLGVIESARLVKGEGIATVRFPSEGIDPAADMVFKKISDGIIRNVSVGYRIWTVEETKSADGKVPTLRAVDWEPYEISAVAIGADADAGIRGQQTNNPVRIVRADNPKRSHTTMDPTKQQEGAPLDTVALVEREAARVSGIRSAVKAAQLGNDVAEDMIRSGVALDQARETVLTMLEARSAEFNPKPLSPAVTGGQTDGEKFARAAVASILDRSGNRQRVQAAIASGARGFDQADLDGGHFRGMTLPEIAREVLERNGVRTRGMNRDELVRHALEGRSGGSWLSRSGGMQSTSDFATILESAIGKILMGAYATTPDTWTKIAKTETVPDFRSSPRYRTGSFGTLDVVAEGAEYKNTVIPDGSKSSISTETRGAIIAITRQALVNDDMGAFSDLAQRLGRGAKLTIETEVYKLLALNGGLGPTMGDGFTLFHANHANIGTGAALTVAGLEADRVVLASQKDDQGNEYLDLRPRVLLVPASLGGTARVLNNAQFDPNSATSLQKPNMVAGLFSEVVDTARITGTRRYVFADPSVAAALVVAFLEGAEAPFLESREGFRIDGIEWKVRHDFRVQAFDPKGAVTNAGV